MRVPHTSTRLRRRSVAATALLAVLTAVGCGISPWDQTSDPAVGQGGGGERRFIAASASIGEWVDERPSGSIIRHGMLVLDDPELRDRPGIGRSEIVVTAPDGPLYDKVADVVSDRVPVMAGMTTNFAVGRTTPIRIERVWSTGESELIAEGRVSFLEIVRR